MAVYGGGGVEVGGRSDGGGPTWTLKVSQLGAGRACHSAIVRSWFNEHGYKLC